MRAAAAIVAALLALAPVVAPAQPADNLSMGQVRSPILTIDSDRLFAGTRFGQRMSEDLQVRAEALDAENETLRAELTAEERRLTERRPTMEVEAFRAEAEAFDTRVQRIRNEQDAKQQALERAVQESRESFRRAVSPVLAGLMVESGAGVILDQRQVVLSASLIDITDEAIAAIDAQLGDGTQLDTPAPAGTEGAPNPAPSTEEDGSAAPPDAPQAPVADPAGEEGATPPPPGADEAD